MRLRYSNALMALPIALAALPAQAQGAIDRPDYWHYGWNWGWGHTLFGGLMMLLFWGGLIVVIILAVRWLGGPPGAGGAQPPSKTPLDILQERFARGEIDKKEFEERKRLLSA